MKFTWFYLHSYRNVRRYPLMKYPLTHSMNDQSLDYIVSKQSIYVKHFRLTFLLLFVFLFITMLFFRVHIYLYNSFFGPFHLNLNQFIQHVKYFPNDQSWFKRIEFIQIELGEENILNPVDTYETIRKYSDPDTRRHHIATYKRVLKPYIHVKLPTRSQENFHTQHPFRFPSFSMRTLKCIVKQLQASSSNWIEKSEYIQYINEQYAKNSTRFNMLVLTKCGILIGYLYSPYYDRAFLPTRQYEFRQDDIAFDATKQYCSFYRLIVLIACALIFVFLFGKALFYLLIYLTNFIRLKFYKRICWLSFPLYLSEDVIHDLWLLNVEGSPGQQLVQLDEMIDRSIYKFDQQLFVVENSSQQWIIVLLQRKLHEQSFTNRSDSPFIICPVENIRKIVQYQGICYGNDSSWIEWPVTMTQEESYAEWLHELLMDISQDYRYRYEHRLRNEQNDERHSSSNRIRQRTKGLTGRQTDYERQLHRFVREEENSRRIRLERQRFFDFLTEQTSPASAKFIARFRIKQQTRPDLVDSTMIEQQLNCTICLSDFQIDDPYEQWPCPSPVPHLFHSDCMLNILRRQNTCPICRHPVEIDPRSNATIGQFFNRLVF